MIRHAWLNQAVLELPRRCKVRGTAVFECKDPIALDGAPRALFSCGLFWLNQAALWPTAAVQGARTALIRS